MTAQALTLNCPKCGATSSITGDEIQVKCDYCGTAMTVPEELRQRPDPPSVPEKVVIIRETPRYTYVAPRGNWFVSLIVMIMVLGIVVFATLEIPGNPLSGVVTSFIGGKNLPVLGDQPELVFGGEGTGAGLFQGGGQAITADRAGNVYALDRATLRVQKFDATGKFLTSWNIGEETGSRAQGTKSLTSDLDGNVYATWQGEILKYDGNGKLLNRFKLNAAPNSIIRSYNMLAVLPDRNLLAVGGSLDEVLVWVNANTGAEIKRLDKPINSLSEERVNAFWIYPAVDGLGNIFALAGDPSAPYVYKLNAQGKFINKFGGKGSQPGNFRFPTGIAVDNQSRVYVSDDSIKVFDANGNFIKRIAATNSVSGIAVDGQNRVYVMTRDNKILRYAASQ